MNTHGWFVVVQRSISKQQTSKDSSEPLSKVSARVGEGEGGLHALGSIPSTAVSAAAMTLIWVGGAHDMTVLRTCTIAALPAVTFAAVGTGVERTVGVLV